MEFAAPEIAVDFALDRYKLVEAIESLLRDLMDTKWTIAPSGVWKKLASAGRVNTIKLVPQTPFIEFGIESQISIGFLVQYAPQTRGLPRDVY
jgi:hypothetical protein